MSPSERRDMIRKDNTALSLTRQSKLLKISRSSIYYTPVGFDQATIDLMHEIDRIFTKYPFFGSRQIAAYLPQSRGPIMFGAATLPTFPSRTAFCIWWQSWIGRHAKCCPGGYQIHWMLAFVLKHWKRLSPNTENPK